MHAGFINNHIETRENGGVVGEWAIRDTTFEMPSGVPMKLTSSEATNTYRNNAFFVEQSYGIPLLPVTESDFRSPICLPYSSVIVRIQLLEQGL